MGTLINGNEYSYASIEVAIAGVPHGVGFKSINYGDSVEVGEKRGAGNRYVMGTTAGHYKAEGDAEVYRREWNELVAKLGLVSGGLRVGISELRLPITVSYAELPSSPVITDLLLGVRITGVRSDNAEGTDASIVKLTFGDITKIRWNGIGELMVPGFYERI
jgi:hypothetical protein